MVPDKKNDILKLCFVSHIWWSTKAYKLMCVQTKNIVQNRDVVFMEDSMSVENDLEMHPSRKNEVITMMR